VCDWPIPSTNAPDREPVISATEPVHRGSIGREHSGMSASRRGVQCDGRPYYRSLDRQNAVRRTDGQSIVLRVRMQLRRRSRIASDANEESARGLNQTTELARVRAKFPADASSPQFAICSFNFYNGQFHNSQSILNRGSICFSFFSNSRIGKR